MRGSRVLIVPAITYHLVDAVGIITTDNAVTTVHLVDNPVTVVKAPIVIISLHSSNPLHRIPRNLRTGWYLSTPIIYFSGREMSKATLSWVPIFLGEIVDSISRGRTVWVFMSESLHLRSSLRDAPNFFGWDRKVLVASPLSWTAQLLSGIDVFLVIGLLIYLGVFMIHHRSLVLL